MNKKDKNIFAPFLSAIPIIASVITLFVVFHMFSSSLSSNRVTHRDLLDERHEETKPLYTLALDTENRSVFILGIGASGSSTYYIAYEILEDGGKKLYKMHASHTVIYETLSPGENAYCTITTNGYGTIQEIKLYVPKDTIQQKYDLSL